jgi:deoxyribose-phosphate aldolase
VIIELGETMKKEELVKYFDYTILKPEANRDKLEAFAHEAVALNVKGACVHLIALPIVAPILKGSEVKLVTVAGFPFGSMPMPVKEAEIDYALSFDIDELDIVLNLHLFKSGEKAKAGEEIKRIKNLLPGVVLLKVIIETGLLTPDEIQEASKIVKEEGGDFVKTCTGFLGRGVTTEDVRLIREAVGPNMDIKASAGIKTLKQCLDLINAGATRLGLSAAKEVLAEL